MLPISKKYRSDNFDDVIINVKYVVLHCMCFDDKKALEFLASKESGVSAHYYIARDGGIFNLVDDNKKAWHAGLSSWKGQNALNTNSIGIELGNDGSLGKEANYTEDQYKSLIALLKDLQERYNIKAENIIAHSDISPDRKTDPGANFDWNKLIENKLGVKFYILNSSTNYLQHIVNFGYNLDYGQENVIKAFQRRFISDNISGVLDSKTIEFINNSEIKNV